MFNSQASKLFIQLFAAFIIVIFVVSYVISRFLQNNILSINNQITGIRNNKTGNKNQWCERFERLDSRRSTVISIGDTFSKSREEITRTVVVLIPLHDNDRTSGTLLLALPFR